METHHNNISITCLPDEIIVFILLNNKPQDIVNFGTSCKRFHQIIYSNDYLWKMKYTERLSQEFTKIVEEQCENNWLGELIHFHKIEQNIHLELISMSPKYYWRINEVSLNDVRNVFSIATETKMSMYYTIFILQEIVKKGNKIIDGQKCLKPLFTLTVIYYAKIVLRHLVQTYLAIKWVNQHMKQEFTPEVVITFFLQWVDPTNMYCDEDVEDKIQVIVEKVKQILTSHKPKNTLAKYTQRQVLSAITQAIYKHEHFSISPSTKVKTLNIIKVINDGNGNIITYGAIYHAVARKFDIKCELIAFPNHLFLEWQSNEEPNRPLYTIDLATGELKPKRRCPFSQSALSNYVYCADSLLQYIYTSYMKSKGNLRDCKTQNAKNLLDFLGANHNNDNSYKNFFHYLVEHGNSPAMNTPVNVKCMNEVHLRMMIALANLNEAPKVANQNAVIKKHRSAVTFAVGMICYHKVHNYMCIIRGWELEGTQLPIPAAENLYFGREQPFYRVIAADQSERFVAQENIMAVTTPFRIKRLEDHIAREFTHFDGFSYVPNDEKLIEYPGEEHVTEIFRKRIVKPPVS